LANILVVASLRGEREVSVVKQILERHKGDSVWLVVDRETAKLLAKLEASLMRGVNVLVFAGKKPEEYALKVYKAAVPDIVYLCDKRSALRALVDFLKVAPVELVEC